MQPGSAPSMAGKPVQAVLRLAAPRRCTVDDHMFRAPGSIGREATFRLQLFTAPGLRPVAVATQTVYEGTSLTNAAEAFAAAVWQQHCPGEELPPVWIQRQLLETSPAVFQLVTFAEARPYRLRTPGWRAITRDQVEHLVGGPVAADRGSGYIPRPAPPEPELRFEAMAVWRLARARAVPRARLHACRYPMVAALGAAGSPSARRPRVLLVPRR
jgi:hypothetical protein